MQPFDQLTARGQVRRLRQVADAALPEYGLVDGRVRFLQHAENTTFQVNTAPSGTRHNDPYIADRYLLRVHRPDYNTPEAIDSELMWLESLSADTGLPVPQPVRTLGGNFPTTGTAPGLLGPRTCSLLRWLDGRTHTAQPKPAHLRQVGMLLAQLHNHAEQWRPPKGFERRRWDWDGLLGDSAGFGASGAEVWALVPEQHRGVFEAVAERLRMSMQVLGESPDVFGLIHADLQLSNVLFARGEARPIDFDDCGWGYWVYDLAASLVRWRGEPDWPDYRDTLLSGYRRLRSISREHLDELDTFIAGRRVSVALWIAGRSKEHPAFREHLPGAMDRAARMITVIDPSLE